MIYVQHAKKTSTLDDITTASTLALGTFGIGLYAAKAMHAHFWHDVNRMSVVAHEVKKMKNERNTPWVFEKYHFRENSK